MELEHVRKHCAHKQIYLVNVIIYNLDLKYRNKTKQLNLRRLIVHDFSFSRNSKSFPVCYCHVSKHLNLIP
jgi:hypothetical protein